VITLTMEQGSPEWLQERIGKLTASHASAIITKTGKETDNATRRRYALDLAIERARVTYYTQTGRIAEQVGFCRHDMGFMGYSPDGIVGDDGLIEIKCFEMPHYCHILMTGDIDWSILAQCYFGLYITGRQWIDFVMYTDVEPFAGRVYIQRIERDTVWMGKIHNAAWNFIDEVDAVEQKLLESGGITPDMLDFEPPKIAGDNEVEINMEGMEL